MSPLTMLDECINHDTKMYRLFQSKALRIIGVNEQSGFKKLRHIYHMAATTMLYKVQRMHCRLAGDAASPVCG